MSLGRPLRAVIFLTLLGIGALVSLAAGSVLGRVFTPLGGVISLFVGVDAEVRQPPQVWETSP